MPCSAAHDATWAWWCWTAIRRDAGNRSTANLVERYSGWRSWTTTSGSRASRRDRWARPSVNARCVGEVLEVAVVGRDVGTRAARERERVLQLGADREQRHRASRRAAAAGRARTPGRVGSPTRVRRRRASPSRRSARGSHDRGRGSASASPDRRSRASASSVASGSSARLPEVRTIGRPTASREQVVERRVREEHAEAVAARGDRRRDRGPPRRARLEEDDRPRRAGDELALRARRARTGPRRRAGPGP